MSKALTQGLANFKTKLFFFTLAVLLIALSITPLPKVEAATEDADEIETISEQNKCSDEKVEFTDITNHWAKTFIDQLGEMGAISGKSPGVFEPNSYITRAEATKVVICSQGYEVDEELENAFPDTQGNWAANIIANAKAKGIINGYPDGTFKPNMPITRAEALVMLLNANKVTLTTHPKAPFNDVVQNSWYGEAVNYAYAQGIIDGYGDGTFGPGKNITRAEMAKIAFLTTAKEIYQ